MAVYKAKQSTRRFVRIVLGLFLFGCATVRCDLCAAEQAETERLIKKMGPPPKPSERDKIILDSYYEPSSVVEGARNGRWSEVVNTFGYSHGNIEGYLALSDLDRLGERDYATNVGSYLAFDDSYAHMDIGFGGDVSYIYHTQVIAEYAHRLINGLYWQAGYNYRSYSAGDSYTLYPGLIYYFGDNYLSADYGVGFIQWRDTAQFGTLKGNFVVTDALCLWTGAAYGQRLYDIAGLESRKECGYILFAGTTVKICRDVSARVGVSFGEEAPRFIKRSLDIGITVKF